MARACAAVEDGGTVPHPLNLHPTSIFTLLRTHQIPVARSQPLALMIVSGRLLNISTVSTLHFNTVITDVVLV